MLDVGHLLDNRYRLDERIATGGMGDVWRGTDVVLGRTIAVKVLRENMMSDPEFAARFYGEARMMAAFRHPGVVEVFDYASSTGFGDAQCAYLVMAYVEGEPLSARLKEVGRLDVAETMSIVAQAADALHAAHLNGTVHRDVKPGNLMIRPTGAVILVDFGVARSNAVTSVTGVNSIVGTALYMAPEQVAKGRVTPATDIYALGAVAYHCLAGNPPFDGDNALQVALMHLEDEPPPLSPDVPADVRALITRAMAKAPEERFASAAEFAEAALAASGLDVGGALTGTMVAPAGRTATSLTGTGLTAPISPVPAGPRTRQVPAPLIAPPVAPRRSRAQLAVLITVIVLALAAAGVALAAILQPESPGLTRVIPSTTPADETSEEPAGLVPTAPLNDAPTRPARPNGQNPVKSSAPAKPSSPAPRTTTPTTAPAGEEPEQPPNQQPSQPTGGEPTPPDEAEPTPPDEEEDGGNAGNGTGGGNERSAGNATETG